MKLLTPELLNKIPEIYSQDGKGKEAIVYCKFFLNGLLSWFILEYEPLENANGEADDINFFGLVLSPDGLEYGYFMLSQLESVNVERDVNFEPMTVEELRRKLNVEINMYL